MASDRHIRRSGDDYAEALTKLLPTGQAWPRDSKSVIMRVVRGLAQVFGFVDGRAADLLERESDPRTTLEMLEDWERNWGLPDPCFTGIPQTIADRRRVLVFKMTLLGAQSRAFFIQVCAWLGYTAHIREWAPFMFGVSEFGDTRTTRLTDDPTHYRWEIGAPEMRFYWTVKVDQMRLTWFRFGESQAGVDHWLEIGIGIEIDCLLNRWKPAHTQIVFDYSDQTLTPLSGTP